MIDKLKGWGDNGRRLTEFSKFVVGLNVVKPCMKAGFNIAVELRYLA
jgi:hypothetical protein